MSITDHRPPALKACPLCSAGPFPARGIHGHIKIVHGAAEAEAWRTANRIAVNKALEKGYVGSTGEVVKALADPGSVLSKTLIAPGSARSGTPIERAVELSKVKKELKNLRGKPGLFSGETCADVALTEVAAAEKVLTKELKAAPPARPKEPAKAASLDEGKKGPGGKEDSIFLTLLRGLAWVGGAFIVVALAMSGRAPGGASASTPFRSPTSGLGGKLDLGAIQKLLGGKK